MVNAGGIRPAAGNAELDFVMNGKTKLVALNAPNKPNKPKPGADASGNSNRMESMMKAGQEAVAKQVETTLKKAAEQMEKAAVVSKDNVEALVQCSTIVAKGFEEMSKNMMGWMQNAMEQSMVTGKQMLAVKTLRELVDLQTGFMRNWMDQSMAETTRFSEISTRVANQAMAPLNQRVNEIVETVTQVQSKVA